MSNSLYLVDTLNLILSFLPKEYTFLFREVSKFHSTVLSPPTQSIDWHTFTASQSLSLVKKYGCHLNSESLSVAPIDVFHHICAEIGKVSDNVLHYALKQTVIKVLATNNIPVAKYLLNEKIEFIDANFYSAAYNGHFELLKLFHEYGHDVSNTMDHAIAYNNIEFIELLLSKNVKFSKYATVIAAYNGYFELLKWLYAKGCPLNRETFNGAIVSLNLQMVKWLKEKGCKYNSRLVYIVLMVKMESTRYLIPYGIQFSRHGFIERPGEDERIVIAQWLYNNGIYPNEESVDYSILYGREKMTKWLSEKGYKLGNRAMYFACSRFQNKDKETFRKLSKQCPIYQGDSDNIIEIVATYGNVDDLEFVKALGYRGHDKTLTTLIGDAPTDNIRWLLENGYELDDMSWKYAVNDIEKIKLLHSYKVVTYEQGYIRNLDVLKFLFDQGIQLTSDRLYDAIRANNVRMTEWLHQHNCPKPELDTELHFSIAYKCTLPMWNWLIFHGYFNKAT